MPNSFWHKEKEHISTELFGHQPTMPGTLFVRAKNIVKIFHNVGPQNFCEKTPKKFFYFEKKYYICDKEITYHNTN
jgi:hypothetical protein